MKKKRHEVILRIIETNSIFTQTELMEKLNAEGFETTQATISRDIKDLRLIKKPDKLGRSCYTVCLLLSAIQVWQTLPVPLLIIWILTALSELSPEMTLYLFSAEILIRLMQ